MKWRHVPALSAALLVFKRSASHPQGIPVVAQRARIVPSATTSPACILCLGQIDLSIWIVINPHTTSATRFRTLCNVTRKLVRWRLGFHEQRPYYIGISSGCRQSPVRTLTYRRMRLHAGGALVVWPWMLFLNSRGYNSCVCMLVVPLWCDLGCYSWTVVVIKVAAKNPLLGVLYYYTRSV